MKRGFMLIVASVGVIGLLALAAQSTFRIERERREGNEQLLRQVNDLAREVRQFAAEVKAVNGSVKSSETSGYQGPTIVVHTCEDQPTPKGNGHWSCIGGKWVEQWSGLPR